MKSDKDDLCLERRDLARLGLCAAGLAVLGCGGANGRNARLAATAEDDDAEAAEVTPGEDLMQEHGVLERILLVYEEAAHRIEQRESFDLKVISNAAGIVRRFVENYHEKLEEELVFPRLEEARRERALVRVLRQQHERGRQITDRIVQLVANGSGVELAPLLRSFVRMYRPHAAREETVLLPVFRTIVGRADYRRLGEQFEAREHKLLGKQGFSNTVGDVAQLERVLGILDLSSFTAS
jgi:hemerythrin-like domain-containing protein